MLRGMVQRNELQAVRIGRRVLISEIDELIPSNPAARFGRFFNARHDPREHVTAEPVNDDETVGS